MIENKVDKSGLISLDLNDFVPDGERAIVDVKDFMYEGIMIKENDFREKVKNHDWLQYKNKFVGITCSEDAIIPLWVYMLLASSLCSYAKLVIRGNKAHLEGAILKRAIENLDIENFDNQRVIVKGCGGDIPESAYIAITSILQPVVKSLMFGEACSTVPVFKN
ncbi:MAG: hypothetical protein ACJAZ2_001273 [Glaciecola sp.]|jgi:hypothetical protein